MGLEEQDGMELLDKAEIVYKQADRVASFELELDGEVSMLSFTFTNTVKNGGFTVHTSEDGGDTFQRFAQAINAKFDSNACSMSVVDYSACGILHIIEGMNKRITNIRFAPVSGLIEDVRIDSFKRIKIKEPHITLPLSKFEEGKQYLIENISGTLFITGHPAQWESGEGYRYYGHTTKGEEDDIHTDK